MAKVSAVLIGIALGLLGLVSVSSGQAGITRVGTNSVQFACPDGRFQFIIVTISTKFSAVDGQHTNSAQFSVEVNGQRIETITNSLNVFKGGSKGHYWGYETYAVSQKMITYGVLPGNSVRVNFLGGQQHISSDIRVDLSN
ncbi:uncharacterized protein LOC127751927 [Frankliniella occidentalis]|uniref:Uncharacterized protein LOC127751927 n=1 Tax=Frankliniella occidentalis TaxID=133901 RepID=A0A9C6XVA8_FRAOC|nr:uncharacterized protein LOC127751927 [Frankliniella occidentalis]